MAEPAVVRARVLPRRWPSALRSPMQAGSWAPHVYAQLRATATRHALSGRRSGAGASRVVSAQRAACARGIVGDATYARWDRGVGESGAKRKSGGRKGLGGRAECAVRGRRAQEVHSVEAVAHCIKGDRVRVVGGVGVVHGRRARQAGRGPVDVCVTRAHFISAGRPAHRGRRGWVYEGERSAVQGTADRRAESAGGGRRGREREAGARAFGGAASALRMGGGRRVFRSADSSKFDSKLCIPQARE
ncbi:hypothetical protein B0H10DRAFT_2037340 [Mycena sp. CBHHK59/15]|nr:hypothetical protein B0H10DRAFT_2037340 [Mycena sp. CBHHK59/15]